MTWVAIGAHVIYLLVAFVALLVALQLQVRVEEPHVRAMHGSEYAIYESASRRSVPGPGKSDAPSTTALPHT